VRPVFHGAADRAGKGCGMTVRLIAISRPVIDEVPGTPELLAFCARVSSTANQLNHETGGRLLRSLVARKEWSPLEMVSLTVEIDTTRDIARQILRHRSFSFQEFSQRYAKVEDQFVTREARLQDAKDRQNSIEINPNVPGPIGLESWWKDEQRRVSTVAHEVYENALREGIAKEVARAVLPEGMTPSRLYMAGTLRSWLHYCALRCDRKTQKEHREIAIACRDILVEQFPDLADVIGGDDD
jgi:thymidylate synthase (FAD)